MVLLHIASVETAVVGGVNIAVPKTILAQQEFATVGLLNLTGEALDRIPTFTLEDFFEHKLPNEFQTPDLVIFHEVYRPAFLKLARSLEKKGIPYLVIPHGCLTKTAQRKKFLKKWLANLLLFRHFLKNACRIQYLSHREQAQSAFSYPSLVLPNGIKLPEAKKNTPLSREPSLLYIGRLEWHIKGFDLLLGAINLKKDFLRKTQTTLTIYGPEDDASRQKLQQLIDRFDISDLVKLQGEIWGEDKKNAFLSADYFLQTSRSEGMPMGLLEAMAHGLPVIVTEGTGFSDIVTENQCGFGCKTTINAIACAIEQAIENKNEYELFCNNAKAFITNNFEEKTVAEKTVTTYSKLHLS